MMAGQAEQVMHWDVRPLTIQSGHEVLVMDLNCVRGAEIARTGLDCLLMGRLPDLGAPRRERLIRRPPFKERLLVYDLYVAAPGFPSTLITDLR